MDYEYNEEEDSCGICGNCFEECTCEFDIDWESTPTSGSPLSLVYKRDEEEV